MLGLDLFFERLPVDRVVGCANVLSEDVVIVVSVVEVRRQLADGADVFLDLEGFLVDVVGVLLAFPAARARADPTHFKYF